MSSTSSSTGILERDKVIKYRIRNLEISLHKKFDFLALASLSGS